jgi:hypothetical protein
MHTRDPYLFKEAEVREEYVRSPQASFTFVTDGEYKVRLTWFGDSDAVGGITWIVPRSLASCVHGVYILWMNDIVDHLLPIGDTSWADENDTPVFFTSQEFPIGRPFITTPFFPRRRQNYRRTSSSSTSSPKDEFFYMVVQFKRHTFRPEQWTTAMLTSQTGIKGYIINGLDVKKWVEDACAKQEEFLRAYGCAGVAHYCQDEAQKEDDRDGYNESQEKEEEVEEKPILLAALCPRQKHYLVWPLSSLSPIPPGCATAGAHLCCERSRQTAAGFRWTKCPYRSTPSFFKSHSLATIAQDNRTRSSVERQR